MTEIRQLAVQSEPCLQGREGQYKLGMGSNERGHHVMESGVEQLPPEVVAKQKYAAAAAAVATAKRMASLRRVTCASVGNRG